MSNQTQSNDVSWRDKISVIVLLCVMGFCGYYQILRYIPDVKILLVLGTFVHVATFMGAVFAVFCLTGFGLFIKLVRGFFINDKVARAQHFNALGQEADDYKISPWLVGIFLLLQMMLVSFVVSVFSTQFSWFKIFGEYGAVALINLIVFYVCAGGNIQKWLFVIIDGATSIYEPGHPLPMDPLPMNSYPLETKKNPPKE